MREPRKSRRVETREFWEAAVQLWAESELSVRQFCSREGLAEHTFYSWRRELMPENAAVVVNQAPSAIKGETPTDDRRRRRQRPTAGPVDTNTAAVEFLPVHIVGDEGSRTRVASLDLLAGASPIEIVGASPWRVRLLGGFIPAALDAVLTVLEERPC
jgi:transposase-like protein